MTHYSWADPKTGMRYSRNGGRTSARTRIQHHYIDGKAYTMAQLKERLGIGRTAVLKRLAKARAMGGLTWANIEGG